MPEVIVKADSHEGEDSPILLREYVSDTQLASSHYADQLIERIGWAVVDAAEVQSAREEERPQQLAA